MDMTPFQTFIHQSKYARWRDDLGRRETWAETVDRWWGWMLTKAPVLEERPDIRDAVYNLEVMPSMRALMTEIKERLAIKQPEEEGNTT